MEKFKVGVKKYTDVVFNGEIYITYSEYWTTVWANTEREAKLSAMKNLLVKIAKNEWFTNKNVRVWKRLDIDLSDMVIGG